MELLAPVKNYNNAVLAINLNADALYCSGPLYSARYKAGISFDDLKKIVDYAHLYDKKVYITLNTIIDNYHINSIFSYLNELQKINVDAIIIQDLGLLNIINKYYPKLSIHASTQMHIHSLYSALFIEKYRVERIVLARELSLKQIKTIKDNIKIEVETFIHGALCTSYSGQCYYSFIEKTGSANKGSCQQHCRDAYSLDNKNFEYLLSFKDLAVLDDISSLRGVSDSLKVEGRLKNKEYLYSVLSYYRKLIDTNISDDYYLDLMRISFNRGYTKGYIMDQDIKEIKNIKRINNTGLKIGRVKSSNKNHIVLELNKPIYRLDVIRIVDKDNEYGIKVDWMKVNNSKVDYLKKGIVSINNSSNKNIKGDVFVVNTARLDKEIEYYSKEYVKKINVDIKLNIKTNKSLKAFVNDKEIESDFVLEIAKNQGLTKEDYIKQLSKTNDTPYQFNFTFNEFDTGFINRANLNEFRRKIVSILNEKDIIETNDIVICDNLKLIDSKFLGYKFMINTLQQANELLKHNIEEVYVINLDLLDDIKDKFKKIIPVLNRVINSDEYEAISYLIKDYDHIMVSELGMLEYFKDNKIIETNFSLNITNKYSLDFLKDLNVALAITSLETNSFSIEGIDSGKIVYGRIPVMITKDKINNNDQDYIYDYKKRKLRIIKHDNGLNELYSNKVIDIIDNKINGYAFIKFVFENKNQVNDIIKRLNI